MPHAGTLNNFYDDISVIFTIVLLISNMMVMARDVAAQRGLRCIGTLRILAEGAKQGQIDLRNAIERLRQTTFRAHPDLLERVLKGML